MAASSLPPPGSKLGPCEEECEHRDCVELRAEAGQVCRFCGEAIGYNRLFYTDPEDVSNWERVHAECLEKAWGR